MKKILALMTAAVLALGMTACGNKTGKNTGSNMNKVEGEKLEEARSAETDTVKAPSKAEIDEFEIAIGDAKLIDSEDGRAILIEFTFKNNTSYPKTYDGIFDETVTQDGKELLGATVLEEIEGYDPLSAVTEINGGDSAKVQKVYALNDEENDVTVTAFRYAESERGTVEKTFKIK